MFSRETIFTAILDGKSMRTPEELFTEISKKLNFPDYFGRNWAAFDECICDLDWIEQNSISITLINKDFLLKDDPYHEEDIFYKIITLAKEELIKNNKKVDFIVL